MVLNLKIDQAGEIVLDAIDRLTQKYNLPPTIREVAEHLGWTSHSRVHRVVQYLRKEGLLYDPPSARSRALVRTRPRRVGLRSR